MPLFRTSVPTFFPSLLLVHSETNPKSAQKGKPIDDRPFKKGIESLPWHQYYDELSPFTAYCSSYIGQAQMQNQ